MWLQLRIIALVALVTIINYFDRSAISFAIQPIEQTLGLTNLEFGWIAAGFGIGYIFMSAVGGFLVDRFGPVKVWPICAVIWSIVTIAMGSASSFSSFFILRILLGVAEGVHFPCLLKIVSDWLPPSMRARSLAMGLFGVPIASVIGSPFISWLVDSFGWHRMFYVIGTLGLVWTVLWVLCFKGRAPSIEQPRHVAGEIGGMTGKRHLWKQILSSHPFQISCFIYFAFGYTLFFALMWLPGYLEQTYAVDIRSTGYLVILPWLASAILLLIGGSLSDRLMRITHDLRKSRSYIIGIGMGLAGIAFIGVAMTNSLALDIFLLSIGLACAFAINSPIYALNSDLFRRHAGAAQGIMGLFFALSGILAPFLTGWLSEVSGNFQIAIYLVAALCIVAAILALFMQRPEQFRSEHS